MNLEEALAEIETLKTENSELKDSHKTALSDLTKTHDKALQVQYNKGFDKAKNASENDIKDGYMKKEDVEKMLSDNSAKASVQIALTKLGVKNPKRAMKLIDEEDLATMNSDDFNEEDFKKKYSEDLNFTPSKKEDELEEEEVKTTPSNISKNNKKPKAELSADKYAEMPKSERDKISVADKLALL